MEFIREDCIYARQSVDSKDSISRPWRIQNAKRHAISSAVCCAIGAEHAQNR